MSITNIVTQDDISWYIWKFISFDDFKKTSLVSKNFANMYKNTSFNDMLKSKYCELNDIKYFSIFAINHIADKYKYKKNPLYLDILISNYIENFKLDDYIKSEYFILLYDTIEFISHGINRKYANITNKITECLELYPKIYLNADAYAQILQLLINIGASRLIVTNEIYLRPMFNGYSQNTATITKISLFTQIFIITDNVKTNAKTDNLLDARKSKGAELVNYLKKEEMKKICPNYFISKISNVFK